MTNRPWLILPLLLLALLGVGGWFLYHAQSAHSNVSTAGAPRLDDLAREGRVGNQSEAGTVTAANLPGHTSAANAGKDAHDGGPPADGVVTPSKTGSGEESNAATDPLPETTPEGTAGEVEAPPEMAAPESTIGRAESRPLKAWALHLAMNFDGSRIAVDGDSEITMWAAKGNEPIWTMGGPYWGELALSPDGARLACLDGEGRLVARATEDGALLWTVAKAEPRLRDLCFSPDGERLFVAYKSGGVQVRHAATGELERTLPAGKADYLVLAVNATANLLAAAGEDHVLRLWTLDALTPMPEVKLARDVSTRTLLLDDDAAGVIVASRNGTVARVSLSDGTQVSSLDIGGRGSISCSLPGGRALSLNVDHQSSELVLWDRVGMEVIHRARTTDLRALAVSADGKRAVVSTTRSSLDLWRIEEDQIVPEDDATETYLWAGWMPDGRRVLTAGADGMLKTWDVFTRAELEHWKVSDKPIDRVLVSPAGDTALVMSMEQSTRLFRFATGESQELGGSSWGAQRYSRDGLKLWVNLEDGIVEFDATSGERMRVVLKCDAYFVETFDINAAQTQLVIAGGNLLVVDLPVDGSANLYELPQVEGAAESAQQVSFTRDGKRIAVGGLDGGCVYDLDAKKNLGLVKGDLPTVTFNSREDACLHVCEDGKLGVYRLDGSLIVALSDDNGACAEFSPDGEKVLGVGRDGTVRFWTVD